MCQHQPLRQLPGCLIRRLAVERHHGGGHPRSTAQLGPPPIADGRDLDLIRAAANGFFEVMNDHVFASPVGSGAATILFGGASQSSEGRREAPLHSGRRGGIARIARGNKFCCRGCPQDMHVSCTGFPHLAIRLRHCGRRYNRNSPCMTRRIASLVVLVWLAAVPLARAAADATLFRLFFRDGASVVSYGEFARVDDQVVFSMPVGGPSDQPRLHVVTLAASEIDWNRTDRYAAAARYQQYAVTRGENDFQLLSSDIARVLNEVALSTDKDAALTRAEQARETLAD